MADCVAHILRERRMELGLTQTQVTDIRQAAAMRAGGQGNRYTIIVQGHQSYLFFERSPNQTGNCIRRWFIEREGQTA